MSTKFDYQKELKDSAIVAGIGTAALFTVGYLMGSSKPTLTMTLRNAGILGATLTGADLTYDYCKQKKWI